MQNRRCAWGRGASFTSFTSFHLFAPRGIIMKSVLALALLPLAAAATALDNEVLDKLDLNQDSYLSREEVKGIPDLTARWDELDSNQDGLLDAAEFARFESGQAPRSGG